MAIDENNYPYRKVLTSGSQAISIDYFLDDEEVLVEFTPVDGSPGFVGTQGTDYDLTGEGDEDGGICTMVGKAAGDIVVISRNMSFTQEQEFPPKGKFNETDVEKALDELTMNDQQLKAVTDRAVRIPSDESPTQANTELAAAAVRANKIQAYDSSGNLDYIGATALPEGDYKAVSTVSAMVLDSSLSIGDVVVTNEYSTGNGGGNRYEIVAAGTGTADGGSFIDLTGSGLQAKALGFNEVVNARQYGVAPGVDSGAEFNAAALYCDTNNKRLIVPKGEYESSVSLDWSTYLNLEVSGEGHYNSNITFTTDVEGISFGGRSLEGIAAIGIGASATQSGIRYTSTQRKFVERVRVESFYDGHVYQEGNLSYFNFIFGVLNNRHGFVNDNAEINHHAPTIGMMDLRGNGVDGLHIVNDTPNDVGQQMHGGLVVCQSNGRYGALINGRGHNLSVYMENNGNGSFHSDSTGSTDGSTGTITGMSDTSGFVAGDFVTVSAGFPSTTDFYEILSLTATSVTLDTNSDSVQSNVTVEIATGELVMDTNSEGCEINCVFGELSHDAGANNDVIEYRVGSVESVRHSFLQSKVSELTDRDFVGRLQTNHTADRMFQISIEGTSSDGTLSLVHPTSGASFNLNVDGRVNGKKITNTDLSTAINVSGCNLLELTNSGATNISSLTGPVEGQELTIVFQDGNSTIVSGTVIRLAGGANFTGSIYDTLKLVYSGPDWHEVSRSVNA
jgi:hypothetical protein